MCGQQVNQDTQTTTSPAKRRPVAPVTFKGFKTWVSRSRKRERVYTLEGYLEAKGYHQPLVHGGFGEVSWIGKRRYIVRSLPQWAMGLTRLDGRRSSAKKALAAIVTKRPSLAA